MIDNIPGYLKERPNWVLWKYEKVCDRLAKIPYQIDGSKAKANDCMTWNTYENVSSTFAKNNSVYSGIGYEVDNTKDGLVFIDIDHCVDSGVINVEALKWIQKFNSYTEYSVSKSGIHIILKGKKSSDSCKNGMFEVYERNRFVVITGDVYEKYTEIADRQTMLDNFMLEAMKKNTVSICPPPVFNVFKDVISDDDGGGVIIDDLIIIDKAMKAKNGAKFKTLFDGDTNSYNSKSEGDLALCGILAFYTKDINQIKRIWSMSGLKRDKIERDDYAMSTINQAIRSQVNSDLRKVDNNMETNNTNNTNNGINGLAEVTGSKEVYVEVKYESVMFKKEKGFWFLFNKQEIGLSGEGTVKRFVPNSQILASTKTTITVPKWLSLKLKDVTTVK